MTWNNKGLFVTYIRVKHSLAKDWDTHTHTEFISQESGWWNSLYPESWPSHGKSTVEFLAMAITHSSPELIIRLHLVTLQLPITLVLPKRIHVSPHEKYLWTTLMNVTSGSIISPTGGRGNWCEESCYNSPRITYLEGQELDFEPGQLAQETRLSAQPLCCSASFRFRFSTEATELGSLEQSLFAWWLNSKEPVDPGLAFQAHHR